MSREGGYGEGLLVGLKEVLAKHLITKSRAWPRLFSAGEENCSPGHGISSGKTALSGTPETNYHVLCKGGRV